MRDKILKELERIEKTEHVKILYAVESGSRAWGFESKDSDYDVRFIYVRKKEDYLSIVEKRDVLEYPINDLLDFGGWDLKKALFLMNKSNPSLYEWISSPIIYIEDKAFISEFRGVAKTHFCKKKSMYHYLNMAKQNFISHFKDDTVKIKRYFYVLRPILACKWIEERGEYPPIEFEKLRTIISSKIINNEIEKLLDKKINGNEYNLEERNSMLDSWIKDKIDYYSEYLPTMEESKNRGIEELNKFFREWIER